MSGAERPSEPSAEPKGESAEEVVDPFAVWVSRE